MAAPQSSLRSRHFRDRAAEPRHARTLHRGESPWRARVARLLEESDVRLEGSRPWDPRVHDESVFRRVLAHGSLALGEAYVEGAWDCDRLDELVARVLRAGAEHRLLRTPADWLLLVQTRLFNLQRRGRAEAVAHRHYDLGNDLFEAMLDSRAIYSCGYWRSARDLDAAQQAKLDLVARKLGLEPGMRVLDVGCGWGGAARYLAEHHGVSVFGVTNSHEQALAARERGAGLPISIELRDYHEIRGRFDRVYSLGMFEHVGDRNYRAYFSTIRERLEDDGLFLLHTIGSPVTVPHQDRWIARYVFPNSMLPSASQIAAAREDLFVIEDWHNFGADYDATLLAWHANFERAWPRLAPRYGERFRRLWRYYLLTSAGAFRARRNQLWQIVLSPHGVPGGYASPR
jgi:cyclopropane-fatty-acyl-phospholipid synthase